MKKQSSLSRLLGYAGGHRKLTVLGCATLNFDPLHPTSAVPLLIWEFYNDPNLVDLIWGCSLLLLILMFSLESRLVFLVLWIVSLIVICGYLICVEYIHDKMHRQLEINGMTVEDLTKSIKEEKER